MTEAGENSAQVTAMARRLIAAADGAPSAAEVGRRFFAALQPYGARAIHARAVLSALPDHEHTYSRISPPRWEQVYADGRFGEANFVVRATRRRSQPFTWLSVKARTNSELELQRVVAELGYPDGIAAPVQAERYVGVTSLAFERLGELSAEERQSIGLAATVLHQRMRALTPADLVQTPSISPRERDCLALVADGRSDWEIGEILGVAETTVLTHVQSARRKLGARSRAQAVAICIFAGII